MARHFTIGIDGSGIDEMIAGIEEYETWLKEKTTELINRCAEVGLNTASAMFQTARYDGGADVSVQVEQRGDNCCAVVAMGETALILEFGAGVTLGYGHPEAGQFGMGPGTYPDGKGHWNDPKGWYLPKAKGGTHTYGNPPTAAMYSGRKEIQLELERIVREVFAD